MYKYHPLPRNNVVFICVIGLIPETPFDHTRWCQHCSGGGGKGKYRNLLKKVKVSQDFWPGLSESRFYELRVTLLRTCTYTLWHSGISNCACLHQKSRHKHLFMDFCKRFTIFCPLSFWRRQSKIMAKLGVRFQYS